MKKGIILSSLALLAAVATVSHAKVVKLEGQQAADFVTRHYNELQNINSTPEFKGVFHYINRKGQRWQGYAECWLEMMDQGATGCTVIY